MSPVPVRRAILDTSVFIATEQNRPLGELPEEVAVSVVTLAELELGVLVAEETGVRARRLATLSKAREMRALPVDEGVASQFAALVAQLREAGRALKVQDAWIAATARRYEVAVASQDADFADLPGLDVVRV